MRNIEEIKELLNTCSDEELCEIFADELLGKVKEILVRIRKRPAAVYTNGSPYGIAKELHENENSFIN